MRVLRVAAGLCCAALFLTSCSMGNGGARGGPVHAEAEDRFPFTTLSEAHTFADYWVEVDVIDEEFGKHEGGNSHEGYVPRSVTLATIATLWRNESAVDDGAVPARFDLEVIGHALHDDRSAPLVVEGSAYLSVGQRYLLGLVRDAQGLTLPSPRAAFRVTNGSVENLEQARPEETIADDLAGMSPEHAVSAVTTAPLLVADQSLTPEQRLDQVLREDG